MEDYREQVGSRLRLLREDRNMSQEDAAHLVGVAVKTWHNWESGKRTPYESNWKRIATAFEVDVRMIRGKAPPPLALAEPAETSQLDEIQDSLTRIVSELEALKLQLSAHDQVMIEQSEAMLKLLAPARRRRQA